MIPKATEAGPRLVIHYHRTDGDYADASLWTWYAGDGPEGAPREVFANGDDSFGAIFRFDPYFPANDDPRAAVRIGLIPRIRRSWAFKDGGNRYWESAMGSEFWMVEGDVRLHRRPPHIARLVCSAFVDAPDRLRVSLSHAVAQKSARADRVRVESLVPGAPAPAVARIEPVHSGEGNGRRRTWDVYLASPLEDPATGLRVHVTGFEPLVATPRDVLMDAVRFSSPRPMGAFCTPQGTIFRVFSPTATEATAVVYKGRDDEGDPIEEVPMERIEGGAWEARAEGDFDGCEYALRITTPQGGKADEMADPATFNAIGRTDRSRLTDLRRCDPSGFRPIRRPLLSPRLTDAVIYEAHVRDFTISPDSGVSVPGKYLGWCERGTSYRDGLAAVRTGLDHLVELGVTHVQLLPVQDFDNDESDPAYNWGYMTAFFNSPEGWYATRSRGPERVREFKQLVQALHREGIGVILDVVYNHAGIRNTLDRSAPNCYYRMRDNGRRWNGSGCGNEMRTEVPMVRRFILNSLRHWVEEYGVDGFRFDLMGLMDRDTMLAVRDELSGIHPGLLLYGEPWTGGDTPLHPITDKQAVAGTGIGAFNDNFRNALKGEPDGGRPGYVQQASFRDGVKAGIAGSIDDWAATPGDSVNYATCHDNLTLWDKLAITADEPEAERRKMQMLTLGILAVSQGAFFLHGGCEFLRSKKGNHNSYAAGDAINQFEWRLKARERGAFDFVRGMIALRRAHPLFRLASADDVRARLHFREDLLPRHECIAFTLDGSTLEGEAWAAAHVMVNPLPDAQVFSLPFGGKAHLWAHGERASSRPIRTVEGHVKVPGRSLAIAAIGKGAAG